ncbi:MAG TPA: VOC family protein [Chloroflexota bacterium]|nr:VOC family protein [Chloroflexota bacterium]
MSATAPATSAAPAPTSRAVDVRGVDFILVSVSDVERSRTFYGQTLGLKPAAQWEPYWYEFDAGSSTIAIAQPPSEEPQPPYAANGVTFALAVSDAKAAMEALKRQGVDVRKDLEEGSVCHMGLIADPDGNLIWIHQRKDGTAG